MNNMNVSKKSVRALLLTLLTVAVFQLGFAQKPEAEIERFIRDYAKAYENITKSRDKQSVLKFVSKDLFSTIIKSNVVDNFGLIQSTYADFDAYLEQLIRTEGMQVDYSIKDILRSKVRGRTGVVVAEMEIQVSSKGEVWNKGTEITTFTLKQFRNGWKILNFNVVSLEEQQNKGTCLTELFKASTGNYMVKTIVPKGETYQTNVNTFEFNPGNGVIFISLDGETSYSWLRDGPITKMAQGNQTQQVVGPAIDEYDAVLTIIKMDLYDDNCTDFKNKR
jgi:hypothetical protein